jgi:ribosomal protein S18 acetylase RimI-like enzyme
MSSEISYRLATVCDCDELSNFSVKAFERNIYEFGGVYKDIQSCLKSYCTPEMCKIWIEDPYYYLCLATDQNEIIIGYILSCKSTLLKENITTSFTSNDNNNINTSTNSASNTSGEIKRLYIDPSQYGKGISNELFNRAMNWLQNVLCVIDIYLVVHCDNERAQNFYKKKHFIQISEYDFCVGTEQVDRCYIMKYSFTSSP